MGTALYDQSKYKGWTIYMEAEFHVVKGIARKIVFNTINGEQQFSHVVSTDMVAADDGRFQGRRDLACDAAYKMLCDRIDHEMARQVIPGAEPDRVEVVS